MAAHNSHIMGVNETCSGETRHNSAGKVVSFVFYSTTGIEKQQFGI